MNSNIQKKKVQYRNVIVHSSHRLCPNLQRIEFSGEDLNDFPLDHEGGYVKVILEEDKANLVEGERPKMRSYTIGEFDDDKKLLTLDMMVENHNGHSSSWAKEAKVGDRIVIAGPGPRKLDNFKEKKYILLGDLTSQNAVRASAKRINRNAEIEIYLFIPLADDRFELGLPDQVKVNWIVADETNYYIEAVKKSELLDPSTLYFAGGEAKRIKELSTFLQESGVPSDHIYMSGYWRQGLTDEEYRAEKHKYR